MRLKAIIGTGFAALILAGLVAITPTAAGAQWGNNGYGNRNSYDNYPNWGGSFDLRQTALNAGYNDGMKAGQKNAGRNRSYNDSSDYRNATHDYSSRLGDRSLYQRYYRLAFERGYNDGAGYGNTNYGGYNNNGTWNNGGYNNNGAWNNGGYNNNGTWNNGGYNNNGGWNNDDWRNRPSRGRSWDQYGNYGGNSNFRQTALNAGYNEGLKEGRKDRNRGPRNLNDFSQYRNANKDYNSRNGDLAMYQRYYREGFENGYYDGLRGY